MRPERFPPEAASFSQPDWPARARVRGVAPIGVGTGWVEAASSLLVRAAAANQMPVRRFVERVLPGALGSDGRLGESADELAALARDLMKKPAAAVNGGQGTARTWVRLLGAATLQPDLERTTLIPWAEHFSSRGLLREHRALCPACLFDWTSDGRTLYEPLRWQFQALDACVTHEVRLRVECPTPSCGRVRAVVAGWATTERCVGCRRALARPLAELRASEPPLGAEDLDWARFVDAELSDILARPPTLGASNRRRFPEILAMAMESVTGGAQKAFADRIGMTEATVSYWKDDCRTPSLVAILRVCRAAGFGLRDVLLGDVDALRATEAPTDPPYVAPSLETHVALDAAEMERILRAALAADPPPTLASIYADARVNQSHVRRRFAALCTRIRERRMAWDREQRGDVRADRIRQIREAAEALTELDLYPSRNQLRKMLPAPWFRQPEFAGAWRAAVMANGWGDPSELRRVKGARMPAARRSL